MTSRKPLSPLRKLKIFEAAQGCCHICGIKIRAGEKWEAEHIIALALNGPDYDIRESNLAPVHIACHKVKTKDDRQRIAKAKRMATKHAGIKKPSRWQTKFRKKLDGTVELRK